MKKSCLAYILASFAICGCTKATFTEIDNYVSIDQRGGKTISYCPESGVKLLEKDGFYFKDLNRNDTLDPYEDWRLACEERASDPQFHL